jgi:alpha-tubulin suppressor-like RCC1 family protein
LRPRYNRLGLHETKGLFMTSRVDKALVATRVRSLKHAAIVDLAMGPNHTVCLTDSGKIITFGRNSEAQLGRGHARSVAGPDYVKAMSNKVRSEVKYF